MKQRAWSHQSDDERLLGLAYAVDARLGLLVHHRIPVAVEDDDRIRRLPLGQTVSSMYVYLVAYCKAYLVGVEDDDRVRRLPLEACIFSFVFS